MSPRPPRVSVVLPTRNPHRGRLARTLSALAAQVLPRAEWELVLVDNGSTPPLTPDLHALLGEAGARIVVEPHAGLTPARLAGIRAARGEVAIFVDDDNVLVPTYLADAAHRFDAERNLGAAGGPVVPEWEAPPPEWSREFWGLLALRERGAAPEIVRGRPLAPWPDFAPVGAGLCVRRRHALAYAEAVARDPRRHALDRRNGALASGGDNDLVFSVLHAGADIGYFPELRVTHLIPADRLDPAYLARLNRGIMRTWVRVLTLHGQCPWPAVPPASVPLRVARAWLRHRPWSGPAHRIRWAGARGQFEGQGDVHGWPRAGARA
jgi:glycosyltransferase involved in cell wall biosynthesis